jgi:transcriptional regulator with XRE-family HTH domain
MLDHGYHLSQIQRFERGDGISIPTLLRLAETFQVPAEKLIANLQLDSQSAEIDAKTSKKETTSRP